MTGPENPLDAFMEGFRDALPRRHRDQWEAHFRVWRHQEDINDAELIDLASAGYESGLWSGSHYADISHLKKKNDKDKT